MGRQLRKTDVGASMRTRITDLLGIDIPVFQAPMGYIARASLVSAVSGAGGAGILETGSGDYESLANECSLLRSTVTKPWGINVPLRAVRDAGALRDLIEGCGATFATTSAGDPAAIVPQLKEAGLIVFHVVPSLRGALKAVAAGADGLVVEGIEGGGYKNPRGASTMVLLPLIANQVEVPIVGAGGICDGVSMAAALTLGAEGVQIGTRMLTSAESPAHPAVKEAYLAAAETDTLLVRFDDLPTHRALRTPAAEAVARGLSPGDFHEWIEKLYFGGDLTAGPVLSGQVVGRITEVRPVADILREMWDECRAHLQEMGQRASGACTTPSAS